MNNYLKNCFATVKFLSLILFISVLSISCNKGNTEINLDSTCGGCHGGGNSEFSIQGVREGYINSGHYLGYEMESKNAYYANGGGCQQCHTNEGFIEYVVNGSVDPDTHVEYPSQPGCFTCHDPHKTGNFGIRETPELVLANNVSVDLGEGNLCASCHRARNSADAIVKPLAADKLPSYWGPHHGPMADVFTGNSAYELPGKKYSNSGHTTSIGDACVTCHMSFPEGRYSLSSAVGGHSFNIVGEVHGAEKANISACITCHSEIKQVVGTDYFDYKVKDYDTDGELEPLQMEVDGLLELLVSTDGSGLLQKLDPPIYKADGSYNWIRGNDSERLVEEVGALYNYKLIQEDKSHGIHNINYTVQILYDTIESLNPDFDTSKRPF